MPEHDSCYGEDASWKGVCDDSGLRDDNLALPWMFDVFCTTQAVLRPNVLAIRTCVTFAILSERLAHDRMAARALATVVMKKEAGYRRLTRHALIIKQDQYNSPARNMGYAYLADCANGRAL